MNKKDSLKIEIFADFVHKDKDGNILPDSQYNIKVKR